MLKDICIWTVSFLMLGAGLRYSYQIKNKNGINPTLSTWIIFFIGTLLSLITYAIAEKKDFRSGILNTVDVIATTVICISIIFWNNQKMILRSFEKWYLSGIVIIIIYGAYSGNAWNSNIFVQILIGLGYIPTILTLLTEKKEYRIIYNMGNDCTISNFCNISSNTKWKHPSINLCYQINIMCSICNDSNDFLSFP